MERPFLKVERAARIEREAVGRVMRVGRVEAVQHPLLDVVVIVAVGVFEEQDVGPLRDEDAASPELEAGRVPQVAGKDGALVGPAVAVGVFENQELVVDRVFRLPVRIAVPARNPQAAPRVEGHLHRIGQLGELLLGGEQVDLHPFVHGHLLDFFFAAEKDVLAPRQRAGLIGDHGDEVGQVGIVGFDGTALRGLPNHLVAVGSHQIDHLQLALHHFIIGLPADKPQERPVAVGRVAVGCAIAEEPVFVLLIDRRPQTRQPHRVEGRRFAKQSLVRGAGHEVVPLVVEVDAVHRQLLAAGRGKRASVGVKRSTKGTPSALATSPIAAV